MTKKKKEKDPRPGYSAYNRFYPPVKKDEPKKRSKKKDEKTDASSTDKGNGSSGQDKSNL